MIEKLDTVTDRQNPPLRVGLIGVTGYAYAYYEELTSLVENGMVQWGAVTIINRDVAAEQVAFFESAGVPIYADYRQMLEAEKGKLDWVCAPTAIAWHTRMTVDTLRWGIPVLLEKPVAATLQDVEIIQRAERESNLPVAIGFQHNYSASTWELKQRLLDGDIGEIQRIDSICLWPRPQSYYARNKWSGCIHDGESWVLDSPLHNAISHVVNLILFFSGATLESRADILEVEAELYRAKPIENFDTIRSEVSLDTGIKAAVVLSHSSLVPIDPEIRIRGTKGVLVWKFSGLHTLEADGKIETFPEEDQLKIRENMFENVVRLIQGEKSMRTCTTEQAKGEVKWANAVQDTASIHDVRPAFVRQIVDENGDVIDAIENLNEIAMKAYEDNCSFREAGAPWAVEPEKLSLEGYTMFLGRKIPTPVPSVEASAI